VDTKENRKKEGYRAAGPWLRPALGIAAALGLWELAALLKLAPPYLLPTPGTVLETWMNLARGDAVGMAPLLSDVWISLQRQLVGFGLAIVIAVPTGFFLGAFPKASESLLSPFRFLYPVPTIAWVPLALIWFGPGWRSILFITFLSAFWPAFFNTYEGVRNLSRLHVRVARVLGATPSVYFLKVAIPGSLPFALTGLRLSYGASWRMLVAAEILLATAGLGYVIDQSRSMLRTDQVMAGIATIGCMGYIIERYVFDAIERVTIARWGIRRAEKR
jgi:ABC-type nitrate/sulfonate/bicarbonate transport system permease component